MRELKNWGDSDDGEIKTSYSRLAKFYHPDVYDGSAKLDEGETAESRFIKIQAAYELLIDEKERMSYDTDHRVNPAKVSDVVPVACRAAADAGIRSVCVTNLSWDFIYSEYVMAAGHHHHSIVWQIAEDYSHCEFLLRLPSYCPIQRCN